MNPIAGFSDFAVNTNSGLIDYEGTDLLVPRLGPAFDAQSLIYSTFLENFMSRNTLYLLLGALIVVVIGFAIYAYQQESQPEGVQIELNEQGISVEGN